MEHHGKLAIHLPTQSSSKLASSPHGMPPLFDEHDFINHKQASLAFSRKALMEAAPQTNFVPRAARDEVAQTLGHILNIVNVNRPGQSFQVPATLRGEQALNVK